VSSASSAWAIASRALLSCALLSGCRSEVTGWVLSEKVSAREPDATSDASCMGCPGAIVWTDPSSTPTFGMPEGTWFIDECPGDEAIIGFEGSIEDVGVLLVSSIRMFCGRIVIPSATATAASVVPGAISPERGLPSSTKWRQMCPRDQMVVGAYGRRARPTSMRRAG
jgi:hypothetical protein